MWPLFRTDTFVAQAVNSTKLTDLIPMDCFNLVPRQEDGSLFHCVAAGRRYLAKRRKSPACRALVLRCAFWNCSFEAVRMLPVFPFGAAGLGAGAGILSEQKGPKIWRF